MSQSLSPFSDAGVSPDGFALPSEAATVRPDFESMPPGEELWAAIREFSSQASRPPRADEPVKTGMPFRDPSVSRLSDAEFERFLQTIKDGKTPSDMS